MASLFVFAITALTCSLSLGDSLHATFADFKPGNDRTLLIPLIPHPDVQRHLMMKDRTRLTRGLQIGNSEDNATGFKHQVGSLFYGYGTHYADLWVGTPPQRQSAIVATASAVIAFPCSGCFECGLTAHTDKQFANENSSSFMKAGCNSCLEIATCMSSRHGEAICDISEAYVEGSSWDGFQASDLVYLGGLHDRAVPTGPRPNEDGANPAVAGNFTFRFDFACQIHVSENFRKRRANGILGMSYANGAFWKQMYDAGEFARRQFSLCYTPRDWFPEAVGQRAGAITLGGTDTRLHRNKMQFASLFSEAIFFEVQIQAITLRSNGGERAEPLGSGITTKKLANFDSRYGRAILDSGSTATYLMSEHKSAFENAWSAVTIAPLPNSGESMELWEYGELPTLLFDLEAKYPVGRSTTIRVAFPPSSYLRFDRIRSTYTCELFFESNAMKRNSLGANFFMGHDIMFDIENERVGFAESGCDYDALVPRYKKNEGSKMTRSNEAFCSGALCRAGLLLATVAILGLAVSLLANPGFPARLHERFFPSERGVYKQPPTEIAMVNLGRTGLPALS